MTRRLALLGLSLAAAIVAHAAHAASITPGMIGEGTRTHAATGVTPASVSVPTGPARPATPPSGTSVNESLTNLERLLEGLMREADRSPDEALVTLDDLAASPVGGTVAGQRLLLRTTGVVLAHVGKDDEALARADALHRLGNGADVLAEADAHLVRAEVEDSAGHAEAAYEQARAALRGYNQACAPGPAQRTDCDYRSWWAALAMAENGAIGQGNLVVAAANLQSMLDVSRRYDDRRLEAMSLGIAALLSERNGDQPAANRALAQAHHLATQEGVAWIVVRMTLIDGAIHRMRQQPEATQHAYEEALGLAHAARLPREEARLLTNLSDIYVHRGNALRALTSIDRALPIVRRFNDRRAERLLLHNGALARLALGRVAEAKAEIEHVLDLWQRDTGPGARVEALREFGEALAQAGDAAGALELFHKEQALQKEIRATNKSAAEQEMRARFDGDAQKRRIELMARDNELKTAELSNQSLTRRLWMFAGVGMALMAVLAALMYRRMRDMNRTLVQHEALLKAHSERDALTGLANRRQFREVMRVRGAERSFNGALLMVDVDHFKRINDKHGHASGDRVLIEMARRLTAAMRADDLVARWGGEEFLVFAPGVEGAELDQLADRVRRAVAEAPMQLESGTLEVTVSVGYAAFPLPNSHVPVTWEQAVNLADLSLYTAKNHGRNCAVGIVKTTAGTRDALREVEADLARANAEGRVVLKVTPEAVEA